MSPYWLTLQTKYGLLAYTLHSHSASSYIISLHLIWPSTAPPRHPTTAQHSTASKTQYRAAPQSTPAQPVSAPTPTQHRNPAPPFSTQIHHQSPATQPSSPTQPSTPTQHLNPSTPALRSTVPQPSTQPSTLTQHPIQHPAPQPSASTPALHSTAPRPRTPA